VGTPDQREPVLPVPFLDAMADILPYPVDAAMGLHCVAQAKHILDDDRTLCSKHVGLVINLGIDSRLETPLPGQMLILSDSETISLDRKQVRLYYIHRTSVLL
jgi:hypothetical protein